MGKKRKEAANRLNEIAEAGSGFFTTKQAKAAGFAENTHPYHVQAGNWIREHRGIYRLAQFPATDRPDLALWALWAINRKEEVEGLAAPRPHGDARSPQVDGDRLTTHPDGLLYPSQRPSQPPQR